jgi:1-acyl-sn-glycerol-3-phosphate acyltransferase
MVTWTGKAPMPEPRPITARGWARALPRGAVLGTVTFGGLGVYLALRALERPLFGAQRPWTGRLTQAVCRAAMPILGMGYKVSGQPMRHIGAVVANHSSWLDIFALNACQRVYFVAKAEVHGWPGIGWLARATGTLFVERDPKQARAQQALLEARIRAGHHLLFFPEGTSTDSRRVLPFKPTLFQPFFSHGLDKVMQIQPVSVVYHAPEGEDPRFYGWWADMSFGANLLSILASPRQGAVEIRFHDPVDVADFVSRKELARYCEETVRAGLPWDPPEDL